jgi:hypothetical protein
MLITNGDGEEHTNKGSTGHKGSSSVSGSHRSVVGGTPSSSISKILKGKYGVKMQLGCMKCSKIAL